MVKAQGFAKGAPERGAGSFDGSSEPSKLTEGFSALLTNKPLRLTSVRHLPFQGRHGRFAPGLVLFPQTLSDKIKVIIQRDELFQEGFGALP